MINPEAWSTYLEDFIGCYYWSFIIYWFDSHRKSEANSVFQALSYLQRWWNCQEGPHYHHEHRKSIHFLPVTTNKISPNYWNIFKNMKKCFKRNPDFLISKTQKHVFIPWSMILTIRVQIMMDGIIFMKQCCIPEISFMRGRVIKQCGVVKRMLDWLSEDLSSKAISNPKMCCKWHTPPFLPMEQYPLKFRLYLFRVTNFWSCGLFYWTIQNVGFTLWLDFCSLETYGPGQLLSFPKLLFSELSMHQSLNCSLYARLHLLPPNPAPPPSKYNHFWCIS